MNRPTSFECTGGALCLDLANTWGDRSDPTKDRLRRYGDLLSWAAAAEVVDAGTLDELATAAAADPGAAQQVLARAVELREAIYRIFSATTRAEAVDRGDLDVLNRELGEAHRRLRLRPEGACCRWEWSDGAAVLDRVLWPVAHSAGELLTGSAVGRVGECAAADCCWLFLDRSRNGRRRWCDMASCGNREKARRHYRRRRRRGPDER